MKPSGFTGVGKYSSEPGSNGLTLDKQGRLIAAEHGDRRVSRYDWTGGKRTIADNWQGKRFNSPNDVIVKSNGDIYFTDPTYGLPERETDKTRETDFCGVYRWSAKTGEVTLLTKELSRPNGLAFSPDEKSLYVANSDPAKAIWMVYPVQADGTHRRRQGVQGRDQHGRQASIPGLPDGLHVDAKGNLFATGPGGVHVYAPGRHAPRPHRHRPGDRQLRLRRRRQRPLHHRRHVHRAREDEDERRRTLRIETRNVNGLRARHARTEIDRRGEIPTIQHPGFVLPHVRGIEPQIAGREWARTWRTPITSFPPRAHARPSGLTHPSGVTTVMGVLAGP